MEVIGFESLVSGKKQTKYTIALIPVKSGVGGEKTGSNDFVCFEYS